MILWLPESRKATFFYVGLCGLAVAAAAGCFRGSITLATSILEVFFVLLAMPHLARGRVNLSVGILSFASAAYLIASSVYAYEFNPANVLDFVQAFKSYYYMAILCVFYGANTFDSRTIKRVFRVLLVCFLVKYTYERFVFGESRPILFMENNFELILLVLLFYLRSLLVGAMSLWEAVLVFLVCALGASRSSLVALVIVFVSLQRGRLQFRYVLQWVLLAVVAIVGAVVIVSRSSGGMENVDRYRFAMWFVYSVKGWPWWEFLTGAPRITPLPSKVCSALSFWTDLMSRKGDGSCYSVVLHSFLLRAIYDHGLLGLGFCYLFAWRVLRNYSVRVRFCVLGVLTATGASVSSFNNVYVALALALFAGAMRPELPEVVGFASQQGEGTPRRSGLEAVV